MCTTYGYSCQYTADDGPAAAFVEKVGSGLSASRIHRSPVTDRRKATHEVERSLARESPNAPSSPVDLGILDPVKRRYQGLHSVTAFPRSLGLDFQSANPPRVHSFAYNCGIRAEEEGSAHADLRDLISRDDFTRFASVYFETVHSLFIALDQRKFLQKVEQFWSQGPGMASVFEAVMAGVAALGSFFSATMGHPKEAEPVLHEKGILEDPTFQPTIDHVSAWILRTLYLRSTTRPHLAWLASCMTMHLIQATGLHHEIDQVTLTEPDTEHTSARGRGVCELVRRIFWTAWRNNMMVSYEYGRSGVSLSSMTCKLPRFTPDDPAAHLHTIVELVPQDSSELHPDLHGTLEKAKQIPDVHPFVSMSKADLCMSLYRHHRLLKLSLDRTDILHLVEIGNVAITAALRLAEENKFWWNVLCTVFQYVCVLLAIDTADSLSNVANAIDILEKIAGLLGTHMAQEALNTAKVLLRDSVRKKRVEVEMLEKADRGERGVGVTGVDHEIGDLDGMDINWDMLLDPWYMSNFSGMAGTGGIDGFQTGEFAGGGLQMS